MLCYYSALLFISLGFGWNWKNRQSVCVLRKTKCKTTFTIEWNFYFFYFWKEILFFYFLSFLISGLATVAWDFDNGLDWNFWNLWHPKVFFFYHFHLVMDRTVCELGHVRLLYTHSFSSSSRRVEEKDWDAAGHNVFAGYIFWNHNSTCILYLPWFLSCPSSRFSIIFFTLKIQFTRIWILWKII